MHTLRGTRAALLIFSINPFDLSGSLRYLISLQFLQCSFFHLRYVIDNYDVSCCPACLAVLLRLHFVSSSQDPISISKVFKFFLILKKTFLIFYIFRTNDDLYRSKLMFRYEVVKFWFLISVLNIGPTEL